MEEENERKSLAGDKRDDDEAIVGTKRCHSLSLLPQAAASVFCHKVRMQQ